MAPAVIATWAMHDGEEKMEDQAKTMKAVWTIVERAQQGGATKSYWTRVGVGFVNRDGSMNLHLDAIPISGKLQVREWEAPRQEMPGDVVRARPRPQAVAAGAGDSLI
jgi:hypothetical protein